MLKLFKFIFKFYFKKTGWKIQGQIPNGVNKAVLVAGGHTSNWDLMYTLGALFILDREFKFIIKKEALVFPIKNFLLSLGAVPISRSSNPTTNYVDHLAQNFNDNKEYFLCIAPEGTRKAVKKWKTGYYHIAKKANVPIIVCYLDYKNKVAQIGEVLYTDQSVEENMAAMKEYLKQTSPKIPENFII